MNPLADIENICFVDFETRALPGTSASDGNVKTAGTYRYVQNSFAIISTWAIGSGPVFDVSLDGDFGDTWMFWAALPKVREMLDRNSVRDDIPDYVPLFLRKEWEAKWARDDKKGNE